LLACSTAFLSSTLLTSETISNEGMAGSSLIGPANSADYSHAGRIGMAGEWRRLLGNLSK
jgi:hypothetical protein